MRERLLGKAIRQRLAERKMSGNQLAERVPYDPGSLSRIIAGTRGCRPETAAAIDRALGAGGMITEAAALDAAAAASTASLLGTRRALGTALTHGLMPEADLRSWENAVTSIARHAWESPVPPLVDNLAASLRDLRLAITRHRSASALPRLTRAAAQLSGIMMLALIRADDQSWPEWAAISRSAAFEAGDPAILAWIIACEATGHYYADRLPAVLRVARAARGASALPCAGTARASALEMRALAQSGDAAGARSACRRAERLCARIDDGLPGTSPLEYTSIQLACHRGDALACLGDSAAARELDLAMKLCGRDDDYVAWALVRLRRGECLAAAGDLDSGLALASGTLAALTPEERRGILTARAAKLIAGLPPAQRQARAARDFEERLGPLTTAVTVARKP